jgi:hypothetical protein
VHADRAHASTRMGHNQTVCHAATRRADTGRRAVARQHGHRRRHRLQATTRNSQRSHRRLAPEGERRHRGPAARGATHQGTYSGVGDSWRRGGEGEVLRCACRQRSMAHALVELLAERPQRQQRVGGERQLARRGVSTPSCPRQSSCGRVVERCVSSGGVGQAGSGGSQQYS